MQGFLSELQKIIKNFENEEACTFSRNCVLETEEQHIFQSNQQNETAEE